MTVMRQCIQGTLAPYVPTAEQPWDERRVHHVYNRLAFGASHAEVQEGLSMTPSELVDMLLDRAENYPLPSKNDYPWAEADTYGPDDNTFQNHRYLSQLWLRDMFNEGVRSKLALFWSNHFVIESSEIGRHSTYLFQYYYILHLRALGNFKEFVKDMGLTPAMLNYLNGNVNTDRRPNENYARELLELFTMGDGNYTQQDIEELSRALTGWKTQYRDRTLNQTFYVPTKYGEYRFVKDDHDYGEKTFLGVTYTPDDDDDGFNDYNRVHDIIFEQRERETARFICSKMYRYFVYEDVDDDILEGMMDIFIQSGWSIRAVLETLFKSEHFFHEEAIGVKIKSHIEWYVSFMRNIGNLEENEDYFFHDYTVDTPHPNNPRNRYLLRTIFDRARSQDQELLDPVNVAGWPGYRTWINETSLVNRWNYLRSMLNDDLRYDVSLEKFRQVCKDVSGNSNDPEYVTRKLIDHFMIAGLPEEEIELAVIVFKEPVPSNYFDDGSWNLEFDEVPMQFVCLLNYLITLPEFQLL